MHPNQENIFGTPVWGFMLQDQDLQTLDYVDYLINISETEQPKRKSNMGGFQTRDNLQEDGIFQEFNQSLLRMCKSIIDQYNNNMDLYIDGMWGNINQRGDFNAFHVHDGVLSGVFYCQVPKDSGRLILVDPAVRSHASLIKNKNYPIIPERLALIVFPSWLEHYVEPSETDETRISISFNIGIK